MSTKTPSRRARRPLGGGRRLLIRLAEASVSLHARRAAAALQEALRLSQQPASQLQLLACGQPDDALLASLNAALDQVETGGARQSTLGARIEQRLEALSSAYEPNRGDSVVLRAVSWLAFQALELKGTVGNTHEINSRDARSRAMTALEALRRLGPQGRAELRNLTVMLVDQTPVAPWSLLLSEGPARSPRNWHSPQGSWSADSFSNLINRLVRTYDPYAQPGPVRIASCAPAELARHYGAPEAKLLDLLRLEVSAARTAVTGPCGIRYQRDIPLKRSEIHQMLNSTYAALWHTGNPPIRFGLTARMRRAADPHERAAAELCQWATTQPRRVRLSQAALRRRGLR